MLLPWILTRILGIGVLRRGRGNTGGTRRRGANVHTAVHQESGGSIPEQTRGSVALTFDDGPDPVYTPKLLDLLAAHGVKATFFLLGSKAEQHPELVKRIHDEGHLIGIHNYTHHTNWLMSPWTVRRKQVDRTADIIEKITGFRPAHYRPPWGVLNLLDFFLRNEYRIVLWSVMARDWKSSTGVRWLKQHVLAKARDGAVVLLHDSGETLGADRDAPEQTLAALEELIPALKERGFGFARVDEIDSAGKRNLSLPKRMLVSVWMLWEKCFLKLFHVVPVDENNPLLKLRVREYTSNTPITLSDGEVIQKGDRVLELHFDNDTLFRMGANAKTSLHLAIQLIRSIEQLLPQLIRVIETNPEYRDIKGLYGVSMIHRGSRQLGFTVIDMPKGTFAFMTQLYLRLLMYVIHPKGKDRLKTNTDKLVPKIIAMSKKELMNRYA